MNRLYSLPLVFSVALGASACGGDVPAEQDEASVLAEYVAVGTPAPDFELRAATRYGVLDEPVSLSDYRGKTVVLAFFFRARGSG
ncbi:MAG: redoxin domain-containing protein [Gemmatimonadota bacterium]